MFNQQQESVPPRMTGNNNSNQPQHKTKPKPTNTIDSNDDGIPTLSSVSDPIQTAVRQKNKPTRNKQLSSLTNEIIALQDDDDTSTTSSSSSARKNPVKTNVPSEHENKRFSQVILMCTKCHSSLAVNSSNQAMFRVLKEGYVKHAILYDQSVIGNTIIEKEPTGEYAKKKEKNPKFQKTHLMHCSSCQEKVGSRMSGNFPDSEIPKRLFDGDSCQVTCTDKFSQEQVVMKLAEWRQLRFSLRDYGFYPPPQHQKQVDSKFVKRPFVQNEGKQSDCKGGERKRFEHRENQHKPAGNQKIVNDHSGNQDVQQKEPIRTMPLKNVEILDIFEKDIAGVQRSDNRSSQFKPKYNDRKYPNSQQEKVQHETMPKKEKKVYTIETVKELHRYIDWSLLKNGQEEYFVKNLTNDEFKSIFGSEGVLQQSAIDFKLIEKLIKVFSHKEIEITTNKTLISRIFSLLMNSSFWRRDVKKYILNDVIDEEQVESIVTVFQRCLDFCPLEAERVYIEELEKVYIEKFVRQVFKESIEILKSKKKQVLKSNVFNVEDEENEDEEDDFEDEEYVDISIFPSWNELTSKNKFTIKNTIDGDYPSLKNYLYTQIMLLREDFIHPLKEGIQSFLSNEFNQRSISVFTDVQFRSVITSDNERELVHSLEFNYPWRKVNWESTKKLTYGSLLCLFPQEGYAKKATIVKSEPIFVTVVDRKQVGKGQVFVNVSRLEDYKRISLTGKYVMFESPAFFASVKPVIDGLKLINAENLLDHSKFPFYEEFVKVQTQNIPRYIERDSFMSLDVILGKSRKMFQTDASIIGKEINVLNNWIDDTETFLDPSQNLAVQHVLRNRVSVIIGPPGTGKSFTGIEIAKLLKSHPDMLNRQLVCITYTNHALDQFLEGLINYFPNIVRVGSRSKSQNEKILDRNLSKLRHLPSYLYREKKQCENELSIMTKSIGSIEYSIKNSDDSLYQLVSKSLAFKRALIKFPTHLYSGSNPAPQKHQDMFNCWLGGDDLRRKETINKHRQQKNRVENSFGVFTQDEVEEDELNEEELQIIEEYQPEQVEIIEKVEEIDIVEDHLVEEEIEAELLKEEMINRFGYEENLLTNEHAITSMFDIDLEDDENKNMAISLEIQAINDIVKEFGDIYRIPLSKRVSMVKSLKILNEQLLKTKLIDLISRRNTLEMRKSEIIMEGDFEILKGASIIGLTSTAASMNRNLLSRLRAPIYLIEEAAELLECQITSVLHANVEHLVMIGDDKQLQPKVNSYYLEKNCNLTVSLFERLIRNGLEFVSLNIQQRMRPEIRGLVDIFYEKLIDHENVTKFEDVNGVSTNVCFIEHKKLEKTSEDVQSLTNPHEAEFLSKLCKYLLNVRQYKANEITILSPYRGQVILIKKILRELVDQQQYRSIRVSTVDDYQGEENEIILLSLVRSNNFDNLGFVKITNRIIVSLSRARKGLYIIGNYDLLRNNEDWRKVFARLKLSNRILDHLPLSCPKHTDEKECIREPQDFDQVIWGGCKKPCTYRYPCGHVCPLPCHHDSLHKERKCEKECDEKHEDCGHRCKEKCHHGKSCPKCKTFVDYTFADCGHKTKVYCHLKETAQLCKLMCNKPLLCGHKCRGECGQCKLTGCGACKTNVKDTCETCKKPYSRNCSDPRKCTNQCTFPLSCGHNCSGRCGECSSTGTHKTCGFNCERKLICGHTCKVKHTCSTSCPKCEETCVFKCFHNIGCELHCHEICLPCKEECPVQCPHRKCSNLCCEPCDVKPCNEKCPNKCQSCNHPCLGLCGEPCPPCMHCDALNKSEEEMWQCPISMQTYEDFLKDDSQRVYYLPECGHVIELESMDNWVKVFFETEQGISIKYLTCPYCRTAIFTAPRYQQAIKDCVKRMEHLKYVLYKKEEEKKLLEQRNDAIKLVTGGYSSGHWFCCENGHPYFIGECGGAMHESVCVDCGAKIGGSSHRLLESNRLATEIDGATRPAWPTAMD